MYTELSGDFNGDTSACRTYVYTESSVLSLRVLEPKGELSDSVSGNLTVTTCTWNLSVLDILLG